MIGYPRMVRMGTESYGGQLRLGSQSVVVVVGNYESQKSFTRTAATSVRPWSFATHVETGRPQKSSPVYPMWERGPGDSIPAGWGAGPAVATHASARSGGLSGDGLSSGGLSRGA